ncbi:DUF1656 domain-containing protein [Thalassospira sp. MA62]|nr:DUF1656 domain-containing protein [Thalassospira sp. MA62]
MINPTINLYGLYVPAILVLALVAWGCLKLAHKGLARIGFYKITVHPALTDLAIYMLILTGICVVFLK